MNLNNELKLSTICQFLFVTLKEIILMLWVKKVLSKLVSNNFFYQVGHKLNLISGCELHVKGVWTNRITILENEERRVTKPEWYDFLNYNSIVFSWQLNLMFLWIYCISKKNIKPNSNKSNTTRKTMDNRVGK